MKKLMLFPLIVIAVVAFQSATFKKKSDKPKTPPPSLVHKTLNGIPEADAKQMIYNFQASMQNDPHPLVYNFIMKRPMLVDIVHLLQTEHQAQQTAGARHKTQGIRIYFGKETLNSKNIILLLVSTVDSTGSSNCAECTQHDYYGHDSVTFSKGNFVQLDADPYNRLNPTEHGAELYKVSGLDDDENCDLPNNPQYLNRGYAENIVMSFPNHTFNKNDTKAEYFPLSRFEDMVSEHCDAIRFYLVVHQSSDPDPYKRNKVGLIMTTTQYVSGIGYDDYFTCETPRIKNIYKGKLKTGEIEKNSKGKIIYYLTPPQNNGELCPFNCN